jgi:response regulator RpfG family c-di-GMP phosphodiesterase
LRGVRHRWIGVLLRDCAAQERCHRRGRGLKQSGRINDLPVVVFMDGLEATRQVKAAPETRSIPIIALTANALVEDREKALAAGCDDFDTKPVELPRLLEKIRNKLGASDPPR